MVEGLVEIYNAESALFVDGSDCQLENAEEAAWFDTIKTAFTDSAKRQ